MSSITVRNLPEGVKEGLVVRAKEAGESLEGFLRRLLETEAAKEPADARRLQVREVLRRIDALPPLPPGEKDAPELSDEFAASDVPAIP